MKFKFIGQKTILANLIPNNIYNILQFEVVGNHFCIYIIDEENELTIIPYKSMERFNENWSYMNND